MVVSELTLFCWVLGSNPGLRDLCCLYRNHHCYGAGAALLRHRRHCCAIEGGFSHIKDMRLRLSRVRTLGL